jgi:hypothetical protein
MFRVELMHFLKNVDSESSELFHDGLDDLVGFVVFEVDRVAEVAHHHKLGQFFLVVGLANLIFGEVDERAEREEGQIVSIKSLELLVALCLYFLLTVKPAKVAVEGHQAHTVQFLSSHASDIDILDLL